MRLGDVYGRKGDVREGALGERCGEGMLVLRFVIAIICEDGGEFGTYYWNVLYRLNLALKIPKYVLEVII